MSTWYNDDGLLIKYGPESHTSDHKGGAYAAVFGNENVVEVTIDLTLLTQTETILNDLVKVPENAHITKVECLTVVGAATGTAIDVGLVARTSAGAATETGNGDFNGLLAASPTANHNAVGELATFTETYTIPASLTGTGALIGQECTISGGGYISASMTDATAFTAGVVKLRVFYVANGIDNP